jgi:hypothetical protein
MYKRPYSPHRGKWNNSSPTPDSPAAILANLVRRTRSGRIVINMGGYAKSVRKSSARAGQGHEYRGQDGEAQSDYDRDPYSRGAHYRPPSARGSRATASCSSVNNPLQGSLMMMASIVRSSRPRFQSYHL